MPLLPEPSEAVLESEFHQRCRIRGWMSVKIAPTIAGVPDRMVLLPGFIRLVELKCNHGALSLMQQVWHDKAKVLGANVDTVYGMEGLDRWFETMDKAVAT